MPAGRHTQREGQSPPRRAADAWKNKPVRVAGGRRARPGSRLERRGDREHLLRAPHLPGAQQGLPEHGFQGEVRQHHPGGPREARAVVKGPEGEEHLEGAHDHLRGRGREPLRQGEQCTAAPGCVSLVSRGARTLSGRLVVQWGEFSSSRETRTEGSNARVRTEVERTSKSRRLSIPSALSCSTVPVSSDRCISGGAASGRPRYPSSVQRRKQRPGRTRPARPARCVHAALPAGTTTSASTAV